MEATRVEPAQHFNPEDEDRHALRRVDDGERRVSGAKAGTRARA
jgi:hypothetical protein